MTVLDESLAGVLCDMDGLLLDSERLARDAFVKACREFGWEPDLQVYQLCIGSTVEKTEALLSSAFGPKFPYEGIEVRWSEHYHARLREGPVPVKTGALDLLEFLKGRMVPLALVTSTPRGTALNKLERTGLLCYFDQLVCGGETDLGKPDPDPYLAAARRLGLEPERCWALEDSANGVRAAHAAGCAVIQVPDMVAPTAELLTLGHTIVESLHDVLRLLEVASGTVSPEM
ncbi:MAG: HAD family hydrolase [Pseudomonadales bacterium]